jgi:hypothetical protein
MSRPPDAGAAGSCQGSKPLLYALIWIRTTCYDTMIAEVPASIEAVISSGQLQGRLIDLFKREMTIATGVLWLRPPRRHSACRRASPFARARPDICRPLSEVRTVVMRIVQSGHETWLDRGGLVTLRVVGDRSWSPLS